jgi:hypothetical protein
MKFAKCMKNFLFFSKIMSIGVKLPFVISMVKLSMSTLLLTSLN